MRATRPLKSIFGLVGLVVTAYGTYAGLTWFRYGARRIRSADEGDGLLDRLIPEYDVSERHHMRIAAPAAVVLQSAREPTSRPLVGRAQAVQRALPCERARFSPGILADSLDRAGTAEKFRRMARAATLARMTSNSRKRQDCSCRLRGSKDDEM